jgi:chromate transporter
MIIALSALFLARTPPLWVRGAGAGAGAAVAAVAVRAGSDLLRPNYRRTRRDSRWPWRWPAYLLVGGAAAALIAPYLVLVLLVCGLLELLIRRCRSAAALTRSNSLGALLPAAVAKGSLGALAWTAVKVGALAFGGGFVIVPLMHFGVLAAAAVAVVIVRRGIAETLIVAGAIGVIAILAGAPVH